MSGSWTESDLRGTIPFEDIELIEITDEPADLLDEVIDGSAVRSYVPGLAKQDDPRWEATPPLGSWNPSRKDPAPFDEVTAVRAAPDNDGEAHWVDIHAVVGRDGELRLPERLARRMREGTVVEVRVAAWAVVDPH